MFGLQPMHLILILIIALVIFGPSRLPELGRSLGKSITEFKNATAETPEPAKKTGEPSTEDGKEPAGEPVQK